MIEKKFKGFQESFSLNKEHKIKFRERTLHSLFGVLYSIILATLFLDVLFVSVSVIFYQNLMALPSFLGFPLPHICLFILIAGITVSYLILRYISKDIHSIIFPLFLVGFKQSDKTKKIKLSSLSSRMNPRLSINILKAERLPHKIIFTYLPYLKSFLYLSPLLIITTMILSVFLDITDVVPTINILLSFFLGVTIFYFAITSYSIVLVLSPREKLLACFNIFQFLPSLQLYKEEALKTELGLVFVEEMKKEEEFLIETTLDSSQKYLMSAMPGFKFDLSPYFSTLILSLRLGEERKAAHEIVFNFQKLFVNKKSDDLKIGEELLELIYSVENKLPESWEYVKKGKIRIELKKRRLKMLRILDVISHIRKLF